MEPHARYVFVGLSALCLIAGLAYFSFWLLGSGDREETKIYAILFRQTSLAGIDKDSAVTYQGIKVGKVDSVELSDKDIATVRITAKIRKSIPVKKDTRAVVRSNLLTQVAAIDLVGSTQESEVLSEIPPGEKYPVIEQGGASGEAWQSGLPDALKDISAAAQGIATVSNSAEGWLNSDNERAFSETLENVRSVSADLAGKTGRIEKLLAQGEDMMHEFKAAIAQLNDPKSPIGKAVIDAADIMSRQATNISSDISRMSEKVAAISQTVENPRSALFGSEKSNYGPGEKESAKETKSGEAR